ncbi:MAG: hypothetical protein AAGI23_07775 [Bacteroidota bacterium]
MAFQLPPSYRRPLMYVLIAVLAIVLAGAIGSYLLGKRLQQKLTEIDGLTYDELEIDILEKTFALKNAHYIEAVNTSDTTDVYCGAAKVDGIKWLPLIWRKSLRLQKVAVDSLVGVVYRNIGEEKSNNQTIFNSLFQSFSVQDIFFEDINLEYNRKQEWTVKTEQLALHLEALKYTSEDLHFQHFTISTTNTVWTPDKGDYAWQFEQFDADTRTGELVITDLHLQPLHDKYDWRFQHSFRQSRLDWKVPSLMAHGLKVDKWLNKRQLKMDSLAINDATLNVWIDKRMEECLDCPNQFVHRRLMTTTQPILIDQLLCRNHDLHIEVLSADTEQKINVDFQRLYASIYNISNIPSQVEQHPQVIADVQTQFNQATQLDVHFTFDLTDTEYGYTYDAQLDQLDLTTVNDLYGKGAHMRIQSGTLHELQINAKGNETALTGDLYFNYDNLNIQLLDEKEKPKKVMSFLANALVIDKENNSTDKGYKSGSIYYERVPHKSIFHQWWGGARSGLRSTLLPNVLLPEELEHEKPNKK